MACVAAVMLFYNIRIRKALPENLLVNRLAAEAEARAEAEAAEAAARMQADARLEAGVLSAAPAAGLRGGEEDCPPPEGEKPEGEEPVGEKPVGEKPEGEKPKEDKPNGGMD